MKKELDIVAYGRVLVEQEARAVMDVAQILGESFEHAVKLILGLSSHGHVITSGIGKGGFIAMKISATLASIGVPSFFLHPAEAVHGDIGRFTKSDLALILSNSGETAEILAMLPGIKRIGCPIISMTAENRSSLAKHSDVNLAIGKHAEAGPLGLAPTTSTLVMLALGDALAMTVLKEKGLTNEEYAFYHPGGALGRSLMTVKDIMRTGEALCTVTADTLCKEVLHQITLTKGRPGAALITGTSGELSGIFTDGDLRRCLESGSTFLERPVSEYMGKAPKSIHSNKLVSEASKILSEHKIDQLAVVDARNKPIGLIDIQDVLSIS